MTTTTEKLTLEEYLAFDDDTENHYIALRKLVRTFLNSETLSESAVPCSLFPVP